MTTQEQLEQGRRFYREKRYAEAAPLLRTALEAGGGAEVVWQELAICLRGQPEASIDVIKQAVRHYPRSGWLWDELGSVLLNCGRLDEAEKALGNAKSLEPNAEWVWRHLAKLYKKRKDGAKQIEA